MCLDKESAQFSNDNGKHWSADVVAQVMNHLIKTSGIGPRGLLFLSIRFALMPKNSFQHSITYRPSRLLDRILIKITSMNPAT